AHYGYNCLPKVSIIPDPEPFNNQTVDELPQTLPSFDPKCYSEDGNSCWELNDQALAQVDSRLVKYKEREVKYIEKIRTLEFYNEDRAKCIEILKKKLETLKLENDGVDGKLAGLLKASKDLDNLIESQRPSPTVESTSGDDQNKNSFASKNGESTDSILSKFAVKFVKATERSTTNKVETVKKPSVRYVELYRKPSKKPNVRGNQRNWNNLKSHQLGPNFVMKKKACFNCGDFNHLAYDYRKRVKRGTSRSHNKTHESFTPRHAAHRPYRPPVTPVRTDMNGARPNRTTFNKQAHSYANRPFQRTSVVRPQYRAPWVPTVNRNFPPVNIKLPTGNSNASTVCCCCSRHINTTRPKAVINRRNWVNDVKASACWVWKPVKSNSASIILKRYDYVDVRGRSRDPHEAHQCQPMNEDYYHEQNSCYDPNSFEQAAKARYWKIPVCYDDYDDDEDYTIAITPKEPNNSLNMGNEHLDTVPAMKSDEFIKSSVENLVPNPSESEGEHECDVTACEDFTTFSNILFDADYNFSSSDDQSFSDKDNSKEIYSNPLFDEEIISIKIDPHHFNAESDLIESLFNHDSLIISSSSKIDSLLNEFVGELTLLKSIPPRIDETDCNPEEEIRLIKRLLYDNSSPCPSKEFISKNSNAAIESFSPSPIPIEDSDSLMEEIDLSFTPDDPMPSRIEEDDYDFEIDILILKELLSNDSLSLPKNESFHFDIPSSSCPPAKPPDGNSGILNVRVMGDISKHNVPLPRLMLTLVPNQEKSPNLISHQGHEAFQPSTTCPMMIYERNIHILDVPFLHLYPP
nr:hypothetical protein [Tanacetum cinerariifolium]